MLFFCYCYNANARTHSFEHIVMQKIICLCFVYKFKVAKIYIKGLKEIFCRDKYLLN